MKGPVDLLPAHANANQGMEPLGGHFRKQVPQTTVPGHGPDIFAPREPLVLAKVAEHQLVAPPRLDLCRFHLLEAMSAPNAAHIKQRRVGWTGCCLYRRAQMTGSGQWWWPLSFCR